VSAAVDVGGTKLPNAFVAQWTLTMALPAVLLAASQLTIATTLPELMMYQVAIALPIIAWLLIAYLQFRLVRHHLRRPRLWQATTIAGGVVGNAVGGVMMLMVQRTVDDAVMSGEEISDWFYAVYPYVQAALMGAANAAILGSAQIACFDETMGERVPWFCASIAAGILGACFGALASHYALGVMVTARFFDFISTPIMLNLLPLLIAAVVNLTLYGLLTGLCMKKLLTRRAGLQRADLIGQFE
jgi:hypothetical protein